jgi:hypothetical protein
MLGLIATDTSAHFQFACGSGVTGPLRLQEGGAYRASGVSSSVAAGARPVSFDVTAAPASDAVLYLLIVAATQA